MRISLLLLAALTAAMPALGQVLTLDEARRRALEAQPALRAMDLNGRAADEASVADGALPDPRLKLGALNFPTRKLPSAREDMTPRVGLSWEQAFPVVTSDGCAPNARVPKAAQCRAEAAGLRQESRAM